MTYYVIAVDHNEGTKEKPIMRTDYVGIDSMAELYYTLSNL